MTATALAAPPPPPPPTPCAEPSSAPVVVLRAAAVVGVAAAVLLPVGALGVGVPLLALGGVVALLPLVRHPRDAAWRATCLVAALLLTSAAAVRDAEWVVVLDLLAAAGLLSLALVPWRSWAGVLHGLVVAPLAAPAAAAWLGRGTQRAAGRTRWSEAAPALRGVGLAAGLLAVFVPLLVSADAAFAGLLRGLVPDLPRGDVAAARAVALVAGAVAAACAARVILLPPDEPKRPAASRLLSRSEWLPPLGSLVALLTAFVGLQAQVLFGGHAHVLSRSGLTYAEYTRSGFWQLLAVTALVLAVVAAAVRWTPAGRGVRTLLGALCLLALVIDASSLSRLSVYVEEYGLTRLRILVAATCVWLAIVLVAVLVAGAVRSGGRWLPRVVVLSAVGVLLALTAANPDARIAAAALERGDRADVSYLSGLSADAVPVLLALPADRRGCALAGTAVRVREDRPWPAANRSRAAARDLLRGLAPPAECALSPR